MVLGGRAVDGRGRRRNRDGPGSSPGQEALPEVNGAILAEWAEWARAQRFSVTRLRPGYQLERVDAFREAICDTFLGVRNRR